jgi:hypothetical protein
LKNSFPVSRPSRRGDFNRRVFPLFIGSNFQSDNEICATNLFFGGNREGYPRPSTAFLHLRWRRIFLEAVRRVYLILIVAFLLLSAPAVFADNADPSADAASGLSLTTGHDITLMPGEHVPLVVFNSKTHMPIQVGKIDWTIDGQSLDQAPATAGALSVPDDNPFGTATVYTAPAQSPPKPIELKATVGTTTPIVLTTKVTIVNEPNCFIVEGDTGFGTKISSVQLENGGMLSPVAGVYNGPATMLVNHYFVRVFGYDKADHSDIRMEGDLGTGINLPGTYALLGGVNPRIIRISVSRIDFVSMDFDASGNPIPIGGSITFLDPDPTDKSGLVKGFICCNLLRMEMAPQRVMGSFQFGVRKHSATLRGHFAVPKGNP